MEVAGNLDGHPSLHVRYVDRERPNVAEELARATVRLCNRQLRAYCWDIDKVLNYHYINAFVKPASKEVTSLQLLKHRK